MKCPKCKDQVSEYIFDRDSDMRCQCGYMFSESEMKEYMEPQDCLLVREEDIDPDDFDPDCHCGDCFHDCILANSCLDDFPYGFDEEGNCVYDD